MAPLLNGLRAGDHLPRRAGRLRHAVVALSLLAALSSCAGQQDKSPDARSVETDSTSIDTKAPAAKGEVVSELGKSVMYMFHAKNNDYWFGSNDRGAYRYDGKTLVNFTTKDGLVSKKSGAIRKTSRGTSTSPPTRASASSTGSPS